jgi:hypothetical protein
MGEKTDSNINTNNGNPTENDPSTESTKKGRGRPRKQPGGEQQPGERETESNIPKLVLVDVPESEDPEILDSTKKKTTTAPKRKTKKDVQSELKKEQLAVLIKTIFDVMATRPGFEVWKLSQEESILLSDPLANILNKNPMIDKIASEYGDYIALIVAIGTIIIPRVMMQVKSRPKKEEKISYDKNPGVKRDPRNESRTDGTRTKQDDRLAPDSRSNLSNELYQLIPSIQ